jgi:hypothetical protein
MHGRRIGLLAAAVAGIAGAAWFAASVAADPPPAKPRVHRDGRAMAEGVVEAFDALLREDLEKARAAIKRLHAACVRLSPEADETFTQGFYNRDQALHRVLDGTLEFIVDGKAEEAYTEFVWVTRTCRECHAMARKGGWLPAEGPQWPTAAPGAERAETAHTQGQDR